MSFVWKHPSLTAIELLWRWLVAVPLLLLAWHFLARPIAAVLLDTRALAGMTFFEPARSATVLSRALHPYLPIVARVLRWWVPSAVVVWTLASTLGRLAILRRVAPRFQPRPVRLFFFRLIRALAFLAVLFFWTWFLRSALEATILTPGRHGAEPNLVLFTAAAVALTLAAFMLWSLFVWLPDLAPLQSMAPLQPTPQQSRELRSKLLETNLVMGIVRVALLVLAMTFSASPLPFQSQQTQAFIDLWWIGVVLLYLLSSDFFHVIRYVTYLRLFESIVTTANLPAAPPR